MGLFSRNKDSERVSRLEELVERLKRDQSNLELEWTNFFDKSRRMLARIVKRAEVVEEAENKEAAGKSGPEVVPLSPATGRLSDRQREIQQQILRRRAGG